MVRPCKRRHIRFCPCVRYFKPQAVPLSLLEEIDLLSDELEAVRLCDLKEMDQHDAADKMKISQSTLGRILLSARKKIAEAIVKGKAIRIAE